LTLERFLLISSRDDFLTHDRFVWNKSNRILSTSPELFNFIQLKKNGLGAGEAFGLVIYPDPPLGSEEMEILNQLDDTLSLLPRYTSFNIKKVMKEEINISNLSSTQVRELLF